MKTTAAVLLVLPTIFFLMMFVYGPLDLDAYLLFGILSLMSAVACLGWAWFLRHRSRKLAWACMAVGSLYFALLVVVPILVAVFGRHAPTKSTRAEQLGAGDAGLRLRVYPESGGRRA
jgi:ABC-type sugar transport system permease subunit